MSKWKNIETTNISRITKLKTIFSFIFLNSLRYLQKIFIKIINNHFFVCEKINKIK